MRKIFILLLGVCSLFATPQNMQEKTNDYFSLISEVDYILNDYGDFMLIPDNNKLWLVPRAKPVFEPSKYRQSFHYMGAKGKIYKKTNTRNAKIQVGNLENFKPYGYEDFRLAYWKKELGDSPYMPTYIKLSEKKIEKNSDEYARYETISMLALNDISQDKIRNTGDSTHSYYYKSPFFKEAQKKNWPLSFWILKNDNRLGDDKLFFSYESDENDGDSIFVLIKPFGELENIIFSNKTNYEKLKKLTNILTKESLKVQKIDIKEPNKPVLIEPKKLVKGEFEKTSEFEARLKAENERVNNINTKLKQDYKLALENFKIAIQNVDTQYQNNLKENQTDEKIMQTLSKAASKAVVMMFGKMSFKNPVYDADKEGFDVEVVSDINNFNQKAFLSVPRDIAKDFKINLLNEYIAPVVIFSIKNNKMLVDKISYRPNEVKLQEDFEVASSPKSSIDKVKELNSFISNAPNTKEAKEAKNLIASINDEKLKQEKAKEEAYLKAKQDEAMKKAKLQERYNAKKSIGQKVCKDGVMLLFLPFKIVAFVEKVSGDDLKLRIHDGANTRYQGGDLYQNKIIWDKYYNWRDCK